MAFWAYLELQGFACVGAGVKGLGLVVWGPALDVDCEDKD